jgi:hypothetical protein
MMYHDPFVPLELALSEQSDGSLDFLLFAAGVLLYYYPSTDTAAIPPLDGG